MSTLRVSTIQDTAGSNSSTPAAIANGIAKAWVAFNGTGTVAIRSSYNVSSITDGGTGIYTVNFTSSLADANYSAVGTAGYLGGGSEAFLCGHDAAPSAGAFPLRVILAGSLSYVDKSYVYVSFFR